MRTGKEFKFRGVNSDYIVSKEDKFKLVSCSVKESFCKNILPEINELYATAELARINKDYLRSAEILQKAYNKSRLLTESPCNKCVELFQSSIIKTLESVHEEVYSMSFGFFQKKFYQEVHHKLYNHLKKMNFLNIGEAAIFSTRKYSPVTTDL